MLRNYIKIALRNIARSKISSFINIAGLAIGISSCILIFLYVQNELSYDKHHKKADRTYRVTTDFNLQGMFDPLAMSAFSLGPDLKEEYPDDIEYAVRLFPIQKQTVWYEDKAYNEDDMYFVDSNFFETFDYNFIKGNARTVLAEPKTIVITEEMAKKYFGHEDPIGKELKFARNNYRVTGIVKEPEHPTHIKSKAFLAINTLDSNAVKSLRSDVFRMVNYTYIVLKPDKNKAKEFQAKLDAYYKNRIEPWVKQNQINSSVRYGLQPIKDIHLDNVRTFDVSGKGNMSYVYIFSFVAIFILLIACINYMNLATARAVKRAKEVGMRKVLGATRKQLIWQFIGESVIITLFSMVLALIMVELLLPIFNDLTEINFHLSYIGNIRVLLVLLGIVIFVGLAGGSYPAFFLSSFKPVEVLKSQKIPKGINVSLRKVLVVVQFSISTVLVIGTLMVFRQMQYMKNKDLGFNKEQLLAIDLPGDPKVSQQMAAIKEELRRNPHVKDVANCSGLPGQGFGKLLFLAQKDTGMQENAFTFMFVDDNTLPMLGIPVIKGRNFSKEFKGDDTAAFIVNEATARFMGWKDAIGQRLENGLGFRGKVVGVVKDFHFTSLHNPIEPLVMMYSQQPNGFLLARLSPDNISSTLGFVEDTWKSFDPNHPIEYFFLDKEFDKQYRKESKMLTIFGYFSALTIFIACLGLFGLSSYTAEQRTKEIGIRKVNGASEKDIILIFVREFMKLIAISLIIAWPVSYFLINRWLQDFAYRTTLSPTIFIVAGLLAAFIALATVIYQAIASALTNPVKALRYE